MGTDIVQCDADLTSHHIEGYVPNAGHIRIPLISKIKGNLWTGGHLPGVKLPDEFRYVVSMYPWGQYILPDGCERVEVEMYDGGRVPDEGLLYGLADLVADLTAHGPTLVHCQAGINRSSLVGALALIVKYNYYTPEQAIALLREQRSPAVLSNAVFEQWLLEQG